MFWNSLYRNCNNRYETYDTDQPWVIYGYFVPDWITRILGRTAVRVECSVCGNLSFVVLQVPRLGEVSEPEGGQHSFRLDYKEKHLHTDTQRHPILWSRPLRNLDAFNTGGAG